MTKIGRFENVHKGAALLLLMDLFNVLESSNRNFLALFVLVVSVFMLKDLIWSMKRDSTGNLVKMSILVYCVLYKSGLHVSFFMIGAALLTICVACETVYNQLVKIM